MNHLDASVLICTRNRAGSLGHTLESLCRATVPPGTAWEVVVVDNGSTDETGSLALSFAGRLPIRLVRVLHPGLSRARNAGIAASTGRIILMTDDDCLVSPDWVAQGLELLAGNPLQLIGGRVDLHDPMDLPLAVRSTPGREPLADVSAVWGFVHGANLIFGRQLVEVIGPFDVDLGAGSRAKAGEDADFVFRAYRRGLSVVYEPSLRVSHNHGRRGRWTWFRQNADYSAGMGAMAVKNARIGDFIVFKLLYWDFRAGLRKFGADRREWPIVIAKLWAVTGMVSYLSAMTLRKRSVG